MGAREIGAHAAIKDVSRVFVARAGERLETRDRLFDAAAGVDEALDRCVVALQRAVQAAELAEAAAIVGHDMRGFEKNRIAANDLGAERAERGFPQLSAVGVIEFAETGRDAGFEWEAAEEPAAECVDGFDPEAAGRLERLRKQLARLVDVFGRFVLKLRQLVDERRFVHDAPRAEALEQARLHLGGGGLGVGDAQDGVWLCAIEEKPGDAVNQDFRLARSGVGCDPDRMIRQGGVGLALRGGLVFRPWRVGGRRHSSPPSSIVHSLRRARRS